MSGPSQFVLLEEACRHMRVSGPGRFPTTASLSSFMWHKCQDDGLPFFDAVWFVPPKAIHDDSAKDKGHGRQLQLGNGEATGHPRDALHDEPAGLNNGEYLGETIRLASVPDVFLGDTRLDTGKKKVTCKKASMSPVRARQRQLDESRCDSLTPVPSPPPTEH